MINHIMFQLTTFFYLLSTIAYFLCVGTKKEGFGRVASWIGLAGFAINTAAMAIRWVESHRLGIGYVPLSNMYESMVFFAWSIVGLHLLFERFYRSKGLGAVIMPLGFLCMGVAILALSPGIRPLMPALQSSWLVYHVVTCFLGYAGFAISFGVSLLYLFKKEEKKNGILPSRKTMEEINYKAIVVGFLLFAVGIITGAVWANYAWGTYWSWDPKETWSLITWFVYAILLHMRYTGRLVGRRMAYVSIVGFVSVIFTYWGVNYLLSGLHSYA
ncbi:MAG: c-type cytochrome biogenesis protein CcsB [Thermodesulfobacteriota bacterium]|nr:c-type cytochrome biogenesis protein CcsB [Thermodesulfobacteriota bacterium]